MSTIASGVNKRVVYAEEVSFGVKANAASGKSLRRVSSNLNLSKDTYESKEIRDDYQIADARHGRRKAEGDIKGELSPASYADFMAAAVRRNFTAGVSVTGTDLAMAADGIVSTTTDLAAAGFHVGEVVRCTGFVAAQNDANNFIITQVAAHKLTGQFLNGSTAVVEAAGASVTIASVGKRTYAPKTGHTDKSFTIEHHFGDINESEIFKGVKVNGLDVNLPPTGMAEVTLKFMGQDAESLSLGTYFTNPTAAPTTGVLAAVNGVVFALGKRQQILTGMQLNVSGNLSGDAVVGSNVAPAIFNGRIKVNGQVSAYFDSVEMRDAFYNESEVTLFAAFTASNAKDADFISFTLPRIKLNGSSKDDGEKGLIQTVPFVALLGTGANGLDASTVVIQDSAI